MNLTLLIITLVIGMALLILEIVALPGGIAGIFGGLLLAFGVWQSYVLLGLNWGTVILGCVVFFGVAMLVFLMKGKTWKKFSLNEESDSAVNQEPATVLVGATGKTIARLAPTGKALIDGELVEVHAINKFIDPDRPIEVVAVEGYRIDVVETEDNRFDQPSVENK